MKYKNILFLIFNQFDLTVKTGANEERTEKALQKKTSSNMQTASPPCSIQLPSPKY